MNTLIAGIIGFVGIMIIIYMILVFVVKVLDATGGIKNLLKGLSAIVIGGFIFALLFL